MNNTNNDIIYVKAMLHLKTSEESGKSNPIRTGYRPNHVFEQTNDLKKLKAYIGEIQFSDQEFIHPGETKSVLVKFLRFGEIENYISIGQKWFIYEVPRLVGEAEIIEI